MKAKKRKLDASDIATILAALRMFQAKYEEADASVIAEDWPDHFHSEASLDGDRDIVNPAPLGSEDIDELCEQLNLGEVTL